AEVTDPVVLAEVGGILGLLHARNALKSGLRAII
ncbi:MAG: hypothetical protein JWP30_1710, partial [Homoserinimonas sp.]|nr:hypothetical protein [Homoserinimonas sp.]